MRGFAGGCGADMVRAVTERDDSAAPRGPRGDGMRPGRELLAYYVVVALYFFAFGLQAVVFPSLVTFVLREGADKLGFAQMALSAPFFALLLLGGWLAERVRASRALFVLQIAFAAPPLALATASSLHAITYPGAIACTVGIEYVLREVPRATIWCGDIDDELTAKGYIVPGLGDAGDLAFGQKMQS